MKNKILFLIFIFFSFSNFLYADINIYNRTGFTYDSIRMLVEKKTEEYNSNKDKYDRCYTNRTAFPIEYHSYGTTCILKGTDNLIKFFDYYMPFSSYLYDDESCISGVSSAINYPIENIIDDYNGLKCVNLKQSNNSKKNNVRCTYYQSEFIDYEIYPLHEKLGGKKTKCFDVDNGGSKNNTTGRAHLKVLVDNYTYNFFDIEDGNDDFEFLYNGNSEYSDAFFDYPIEARADFACKKAGKGSFTGNLNDIKNYSALKTIKQQGGFLNKLRNFLAFGSNAILSLFKPTNLGASFDVACEIGCTAGKVSIKSNKIGVENFCSVSKIRNTHNKLLKKDNITELENIDKFKKIKNDFNEKDVKVLEKITSDKTTDFEKLEKQAYLSNKETQLNELYNLKKYDEKYSKLRDRIIDDKNYNPINNLFNNKKDGELISVPKKENNPKFNEEYANFLENNKLMDTDLEYEIIKNLDRTNTKDDFLNNLDLNFMSGTRRYTQPENLFINKTHYGSYSSKPNTETNTNTSTNTSSNTETNTNTNTSTNTNTNTETETNTHTNTNTNTNTHTNTNTNTSTNANTETNTHTNTNTNTNTENKNDISNKVETSTETNVSTNTKADNKVDVNVDVKVKVDDINIKLDDSIKFDDDLQIKNNDYLNKLIEEKNNFLNSIPIDEYMNVFSDMFNSIKELLDFVKTLKIKKIENYSFVSSCSQSYSLKITENYIVDGDYDICKTVEPAYPILHTILKLVFLVLSLFSIYKLSILLFR